jgi:hypothetical protein
MNIVRPLDPASISRVIGTLSSARKAYEERRAAQKGLDLASYLGAKTGTSVLKSAVDNLMQAWEVRDRLMVPTSVGIYSPNPKAFLAAQSKVNELEFLIRRLLAKKPKTACMEVET